MRKTILVTLTLVPLACGGGGDAGGPPARPSGPCRDLGYGTAPQALAGEWACVLKDCPSTLWLFENGAFVDLHTIRPCTTGPTWDHEGGSSGRFTGFWGVDADGKLTVVYSLTNECPPTGTIVTAIGVTADSTSISGAVQYSPMPLAAGTPWSITREALPGVAVSAQ